MDGFCTYRWSPPERKRRPVLGPPCTGWTKCRSANFQESLIIISRESWTSDIGVGLRLHLRPDGTRCAVLGYFSKPEFAHRVSLERKPVQRSLMLLIYSFKTPPPRASSPTPQDHHAVVARLLGKTRETFVGTKRRTVVKCRVKLAIQFTPDQ